MKKSIAIILIVVGILSVIFGIICFRLDAGSYEHYESYGGDAYTGIQNAAAKTAGNVQHTNKILRFGFGSLLLVIGLLSATGGVVILKEEKNAGKSEIPAYQGSVSEETSADA